jgi:hypothetical protein
MKKILLLICSVFCASVLFAQVQFNEGGVTYEVTSPNEVKVESSIKTLAAIVIPETVVYQGTTYTVTAIGDYAFDLCLDLASISMPNTITIIGEGAFCNCRALSAVEIPSSVTFIGNYAFERCNSLASVTCLADTAPVLGGDDVFYPATVVRVLNIPYGSDYSAWLGATDWNKTNYVIKEGEYKVLSDNFTINKKVGLINNGVLRITQQGELVNLTQYNVEGIFEVETPVLPNDRWSFIGAPFNDYKLEAVIPGTRDITVSLFDYSTGAWSDEYATIANSVEAGEGYFSWSYTNEPTVFTTYGDGKETYDFSKEPKYELNHSGVKFIRNVITSADRGNWMALCNPYTFKLDVFKLVFDQINVKGEGIYRFNGTTWDFVEEGILNMTEGFFVNFNTPGNNWIYMVRSHRYTGEKAKSNTSNVNRITLLMNDGERESKLFFAQNNKAKQGDDAYDANKMFSPFEVSEPYFLTDGVALAKETVKRLPYTATLNVRSYESKDVSFKINDVPENLVVYLLDNGQEVKMESGVEYTTNILAGENSDRFKLVVKKAHENLDGLDNEIEITNYNREVSIETSLSDLYIEVYNTLGKKVFETRDYDFTLGEELPAGSYIVKAYNRLALETTKIVVK